MPMFLPADPKRRAAYRLAQRKLREYRRTLEDLLRATESHETEEWWAQWERVAERERRWAGVRRRNAAPRLEHVRNSGWL